MKTRIQHFTALGLALFVGATIGGAQETNVVTNSPVATNQSATALSPREARRVERRAERRAERQRERQREQAEGSTNAVPAASEAVAASVTAPPPRAAESGAKPEPAEAALRLNFRGVALDMVLNYLSEAAGFIIVLETPVKGTVDVWSNNPLTKAEAVDLLNSVLNRNGYAALQNGRTLTIVSKEDAKKRDIPIKIGGAFRDIPKNDEMVTQIIPVRNINVTQLARDLSTLVPSSASLVANEGGNSLVMTDTQVNIHRVAQIVSALDGQVSASASIRVFPLRYADAKALAATIKDLFQDTSSTSGRTGGGNRSGGGGGFAAGLAAFGGFGGGGNNGGGGRTGGSTSANSVATAAKVTAVADEHSNSLIISASESQFAAIEQLIKSVDTDVQDLTELRVFHLKNADPTETADMLSNLFPDTTRQEDTRGGGVRFGGGGFQGFGGGRQASTAATETDRSKKRGKVIAVPDPRTGSIVVSAAKELMPQIAEMVLQLDTDPAKKKKVFVYNLENANVQDVEAVLRGLFESQNSRNTANSQNNALQNRANQAGQTQTGNSGFGGGFGNTGQGGGGGLR